MTWTRGGWWAVVLLGCACSSGGSGPGPEPEPVHQIDGIVSSAGSGVEITLSCADQHPRITYTDARGRFALDGVPATACTFTPAKPGYRFDPPSVELAVAPSGQTRVEFVGRPLFQVRGMDLSGTSANVDVMFGGKPVEDAQVEINGQAIPFLRDRYSGVLATPVEVGGMLSLEVSRGGLTVAGTGRVPETPVLSASLLGAYVTTGEALIVRWSSATSPDRFSVEPRWPCGPSCGTGTSFEAPGSARTLTIPAGALPVGPVRLSVFAYNDGEFTGDYVPADSHAGMNIRGESRILELTVGTTPGRRVSGVVSGTSGGAVLDLACPGAPTRAVGTAEDGAFDIGGVPSTRCTLTPQSDGYAYDPPSVAIPAYSGNQAGVSFQARAVLQVRGHAICATAANVEVRHAGQPVEDAVVLVNGQLLSWAPLRHTYELSWFPALLPGQAVSLDVTTPWGSVTGAAVLPESPVVISPAPESFAGGDILVRWTSATTPEGFLVNASWWLDPSTGTGLSFPASGTARQLTLPADQLPSGRLRITVDAVNDGQLTGDAYGPFAFDGELGPGMNVISGSPEVWVSR